MIRKMLRTTLALLLAVLMMGGPALAQQKVVGQAGPDYSKGRGQFPNVLAPYAPRTVAEPELVNSPRIEQLIREGKLYLTMQDAITLALENNLDISVQRYTPWLAETDILRQEAGNGFVNFDPQVTSVFNWNRNSFPVNNPLLAGAGTQVSFSALTNYTTQANFQYTQGFKTGTGYSITLNNSRQSSTSLSNFFNPSISSTLAFGFSQPLLNGFGLLPNTRFLKIARNNKRVADLTFSNQVILTVSQVQNLYWDLVFAREDVKVKQQSLELAEKLYNDNKRQVEIGTLAPIEVVRAEAEVARTRQELIVARTFLLQQQTQMKNAISKNPMDPLLVNVEVIPTDVVVQPPQIEVLPLQDAVMEAWEKRPDVQQSRIDLETRGITVKATRNALLPSLTVSGQFSGTGLAGNTRAFTTTTTTPTGTFNSTGVPIVDSNGNPLTVNGTPAFSATPIVTTTTTTIPATQGGLGDAYSVMKDFNFPNYGVRFDLTIPIRNRAAQADNTRALLEQRQSETRLRQLQNNVVVEVRNAQIALEQSRARVEAAQKSRELQERTLDAEQKKYQLGASTIFLVIQAQRDLAQARSVEVRALTDLMKAKIEFERALGRTLNANNIQIAAVQRGQIIRETNIPGNVDAQLEAVQPKGKY
jgi:outer membrane protein TolC